MASEPLNVLLVYGEADAKPLLDVIVGGGRQWQVPTETVSTLAQPLGDWLDGKHFPRGAVAPALVEVGYSTDALAALAEGFSGEPLPDKTDRAWHRSGAHAELQRCG